MNVCDWRFGDAEAWPPAGVLERYTQQGFPV
jgi:hypothetical protein